MGGWSLGHRVLPLSLDKVTSCLLFLVEKRPLRINHSSSDLPQLLLLPIFIFSHHIALVWFVVIPFHRFWFENRSCFFFSICVFATVSQTRSATSKEIFSESVQIYWAWLCTYQLCKTWSIQFGRRQSDTSCVCAFLSRQILDMNRSIKQHEIIYCSLE